MLLLDQLVTYLPIADIPENIITTYLPGDDCLDHCATIDLVFKSAYIYKKIEHGDEFSYVYTCLDPGFAVLHSFDDQPSKTQFYQDKLISAFWHKNGELHRDNDEPATRMKYYSGEIKQWYKYGKRHRDNDEPAIISFDGKNNTNPNKEWWNHGQRHRDNDEPAVMYSNGHKEWWNHGKIHRDNDLPAIIRSDGTKEWYKYGKRHRDNGEPAFIGFNGDKAWWRHGKASHRYHTRSKKRKHC